MKTNKLIYIIITVVFFLFLQKFAISQNTAYDSEKNVLVNGKPIFPFGMYFSGSNLTAEKRLTGMKDMIEAGFNTAYISSQGKGFNKLLDLAEMNNFYYV